MEVVICGNSKMVWIRLPQPPGEVVDGNVSEGITFKRREW